MVAVVVALAVVSTLVGLALIAAALVIKWGES
jgi:hypothetical protein